MMHNNLIFGKDNTPNIVSIEVDDGKVEVFTETEYGVKSIFLANEYWIVAESQLDKSWQRLDGWLYYKFIKTYKNKNEYLKDRKRYKNRNIYSVYDSKESSMLLKGITYFKGMKVADVSVLGFDIESTTLKHTEKSKVLIISNTFRRNGIIIRKLFSYSDYETEAEMFDDWCNWVKEINPSVMIGHNIFGFDLPYLQFCANKAGTSLSLGRDESDVKFDKYESKFRFDGSQDYNYNRCYIYGREIIDTMFMAMKYDAATRKYPNYRLKELIKFENLEVKNRQHYDAADISKNYLIPEEWEKIKSYAEFDADDALALYDLMIPAYFYLTPSIPKSFQAMLYTASGSQINAFLIRSYLQEGHSLPSVTEAHKFEGATSLGNPGCYKNVFKVDVASLYPSIMLEYKVGDANKDPKQHFFKMVEYFTNERLSNKKLAKETGDRYYKDLEQAQKIIINSAYGMMGTPGLLFNSPKNAEFVTRTGREILKKALDWASENDFTIVNADTDSISITFNGEPLSASERLEILECINSMYPERIRFEDDGYYTHLIVVKIKNYVLVTEDGKMKYKGSALKATGKGEAMREFIKTIIDRLIKEESSEIVNDYNSYVKEIYNLVNIDRWTTKKTLTETVYTSERSNETKVVDAVENSDYEVGDKIFVFFDVDDKLRLREDWKGNHSKIRLLKKLFDTAQTFENVLDLNKFPNYTLKRNENLLNAMVGLPLVIKEKKTRKKKDAPIQIFEEARLA